MNDSATSKQKNSDLALSIRRVRRTVKTHVKAAAQQTNRTSTVLSGLEDKF